MTEWDEELRSKTESILAARTMSTPQLLRGDPVTVSWRGTTRYGVVAGDAFDDALPTGARFIPIFFDDEDATHNVDTRAVMLGYHS